MKQPMINFREANSSSVVHDMPEKKDKEGKVGERVRDTGSYICDNCGHYQYFDKGDEFEDCRSCYEPDITWEEEQ